MNNSDPFDQIPSQRVLTVQIVVGALVAGVLSFMGIVLYIHIQSGPLHPAGTPMVSYIAVLMFAILLMLSMFLPGQLMRALVARIADGSWKPPEGLPASAFATDTGKLLAVFQTGNLIGWAMLEGSAFLALMAFLLEGEWFVLSIVGAYVLLMLATFPTSQRVRNWLDRQSAVIEEMRKVSR